MNIHINRAASYLKLLCLPPTLDCECSASHCSNHFQLKNGWAFPGRSPAGELRMYFFCDPACYLAALPPQACWRA